jgi:hypothetical protein
LNLNGSNELEYMKWKNALSSKLVCFSLDWMIDWWSKWEPRSCIYRSRKNITVGENLNFASWFSKLQSHFQSQKLLLDNFSNLQPDFQSQKLLLANISNLQPYFQSQKLLLDNFSNLQPDFQSQKLLLDNFSNLQLDFQSQKLLLANISKMKSDF